AVDNLSDEDKQTVLRDGFLVGKKDTTDYIPGNELISTLVTRYDIAHKDLKNLYGTGKIIVFDPIHGSVEFLPALFTPEKVIYKYNGEVKFVSSHYGSALVAEFENYISESDLLRFGAQPITLPDHSNDIIMIFYPTKADNFYKACVVFKPNGSWQVMDEDVKIITENITDSVIFSNDIAHGKVGNILPYDSYYIPLGSRGEFKLINNFDEFLKLVDGLGVNIRLYNDGAGVTVTDSHNKTASLPNSNTKIAEYLTSEYDLGHDSIKALLDNKELFVLRKEAASPFVQDADVQHGSEVIHEVYPEIIDDTIDIGDDDLVETGMIASVADEEEVTPMMVDMMPRFIETSTDLGKTILLMNYDEESFEDFYGTEEYNNLLNKCRRVFKTIGELMSDLRKYINMN
ncbi:MAG: hypothetical protein ACLFUH_09295, partial [Bacteroidales bacterium]